MGKTIRIKMPVRKRDKTIKLSEAAIAKHTLLGAASPLTGFVDMAAFGIKVTNAKDLRNQGTGKIGTRSKKYQDTQKACGIEEGQTRDTENTLYWYVQKVRNCLLSKFKGSEESLTEFGFDVVISQTGTRKNVRIELPIKNPENMIILSEEIIEEHDALGAASPLTGNVDMAAFETLTLAARALYTEWETSKGEHQSFNNQALVILGYGEGQTVYTEGTVYYILCAIRDRLLDVHEGHEESLSEWGFDVKIGHSRKIKKGNVIIILGNVTSPGISNVQFPDIEPGLSSLFKFEAIDSGMRFYASVTAGEAPGPSTAFFDVLAGDSITKTFQQLIEQLGIGEAKPFLNVQNVGTVAGQYKITITIE